MGELAGAGVLYRRWVAPSAKAAFILVHGLGPPYWDASARGTIIGLTGGSGRARLVRAALKSMAHPTMARR